MPLVIRDTCQMSKAYKDKSKLKRLYHKKNLSCREIGDKYGVDGETVRYWMKKLGVKRRDRVDGIVTSKSKGPVPFITSRNDGYNAWSHQYDSEKETVFTHRLLAVAKYGIDAVKDMHVHHKNGIKFDNRPDNIEILESSEHRKKHYDQGDTLQSEDREKVTKKKCREMNEYRKSGMMEKEIVDKYNVSRATVWRHTKGDCHHD